MTRRRNTRRGGFLVFGDDNTGLSTDMIDTALGTLEDLTNAIQSVEGLKQLLSDIVVENGRLSADNRRLSAALVSATQGGKEGLQTVRAAQEQVRIAQQQVKDLLDENTDLSSRLLELEELNGSMMSMYVSSFQLHATLDLDQVIQTIEEIVLNFVGARSFAVILQNAEGTFDVAAEKNLQGRLARTDIEPRGVLAEVVGSKVAYVHTSSRPAREGLLAAVPLAMEREVIGAVLIFELLSQKERLLRNDVELLSLLGGHAASALVSARLYARADRKLKTLQGMIGLLQRAPSR